MMFDSALSLGAVRRITFINSSNDDALSLDFGGGSVEGVTLGDIDGDGNLDAVAARVNGQF